jgi:hypothetical protein
MLLALQRDYQTLVKIIKEWAYSDKFLVLSIFAIFSENAKKGFLTIKSFANFVQSFHKTYGNESMIMNVRSLLAYHC